MIINLSLRVCLEMWYGGVEEKFCTFQFIIRRLS